jgi:hypothetical protein
VRDDDDRSKSVNLVNPLNEGGSGPATKALLPRVKATKLVNALIVVGKADMNELPDS